MIITKITATLEVSFFLSFYLWKKFFN